jgi:hypothetical protein
MADIKARRSPPTEPRSAVRFGFGGYGLKNDGSVRTNGLGVGAVTNSTPKTNYEIIPCYGAATITVRLKVATTTGTLDLFPVGPDFNPDQGIVDDLAFASLVGTIYSTGNPTQVAVGASTEVVITYTGKGEGYLLIKYVGTAVGAGTVTYCDVSWLMQSGA